METVKVRNSQFRHQPERKKQLRAIVSLTYQPVNERSGLVLNCKHYSKASPPWVIVLSRLCWTDIQAFHPLTTVKSCSNTDWEQNFNLIFSWLQDSAKSSSKMERGWMWK